jgi:hypothetical protein
MMRDAVMSLPIPPEKVAAFEAAVHNGRKIEAIKIYRETTGAGLAEAKSAVEKIEAEWRAASPEKFKASPAGKGCSTVFVLAVITVAIAVWCRA